MATRKRKNINDADMAERLARLERIADMLDRGEIGLPRDGKGKEVNGFYADDMERVADFAEDMRGRLHIRAKDAEPTARVTVNSKPTDLLMNKSKVATKTIEATRTDTPETPMLVSTGRKNATAMVTLNYGSWDGIAATKHLTEYDESVHNAVCTLYEMGYREISPGMIWKALGMDTRPNKQQAERIRESYTKMTRIRVSIDATGEMRAYGDYTAVVIEDNILPARLEMVEVNGKTTRDCLILRECPPLYAYSGLRKQVAAIPRGLLQVPRLQSREQNIALKNYLLKRVEAMKNSSVSRVIRYVAVYEAIGVPKGGNSKAEINKRTRTRRDVARILDYWTNRGYIDGYKERQNMRTPDAVEIGI